MVKRRLSWWEHRLCWSALPLGSGLHQDNGCACSPLSFDAWPSGLFRNCPLQQPFDVNRTS